LFYYVKPTRDTPTRDTVSYAQEKRKAAHTKEKITPRLIQIFDLKKEVCEAFIFSFA